jgi:hypothetical protein
MHRKDRRNPHWVNTAAKYGKLVMLLWTGLSEEEAFCKERQSIKDLREYSPDTMTNMTDGGEGSGRSEDVAKTIERLKAFHNEHGRHPVRAEDPPDLRVAVTNYRVREPEYIAWYKTTQHKYFDVDGRKAEVKAFYAQYNRLPRKTEERRLYEALVRYCTRTSSMFDAEFRIWAEQRGHGTGTQTGKRKESKLAKQRVILEVLKEYGSISTTHPLYHNCVGYCARSQKTYDPEFHKQAVALGWRGLVAPPNKNRLTSVS